MIQLKTLLRKIRFTLIDMMHFRRTIAEVSHKYAMLTTMTDRLTYSALHSVESGITNDAIADEEVVVSLTTFRERYHDVYLAVESIMQGSVKPNRIVLWVSEELKDDPIPITLQRQMQRGLEIRFRRDVRSFTKLIYALKEFPDSAIITIDDDVLYEFSTIENLLNAHRSRPGTICANDIRIMPDKEHFFSHDIMDWKAATDRKEILREYVFEGFAGVLYPPHSLSDEVFNETAFMNICTTADDIWFSAMAMLKGTDCIYACPHMGGFRIVSNERIQDIALSKVNTSENAVCLKKVFEKYMLI